MKILSIKIFTSSLLLLTFSLSAFAQGGQKWSVGLNSVSPGDALGTSNSQNLVFKVNSLQQMVILTNGKIQLNSLSGAGTGVCTYDANGTIIPLNFPGSATMVLAGNGTFINGSSFSQWITNGNSIYYNAGNVGIGTSTPNYPLTVQGNALINGTLFANNLSAANGLMVGGFRVVNGMVDSIISTAGTVSMVANNLIATNAISAQNITANKTITSPVITTSRIRPMPGDSLIRFGDSTFYMDQNSYNIFTGSGNANLACLYCMPSSFNGIALGYPNLVKGSSPFQTTSIAIGTNNYLISGGIAVGGGNNISNGAGIAIGYTNKLSSGGLLAIGAGLNNTIPGSIMLGINSPAIFIGTNDYVGVGTTTPQYPLEVVGTIHSCEVKVTTIPGCDFVFDKKYALLSLDSLNEFLNHYHHLPGIASAKEMAEEGDISLGKMDSQLLQKIEELTLYVIQQQKEMNVQKEYIKRLEQKLDAMATAEK